VWPAGVFVASLGIVRHLSFRERRKKFSIVPATGLHSESNRVFPKPFRRVPSKQGPPKDLFSISCLPSGLRKKDCAKSAPNLAFSSDRKTHTVARRSERPPRSLVIPKSVHTPRDVIPNRAENPVRNLLLGCSSSPAPLPEFPMWKSSGNSVGSDD
jgi:hypothetical protein